MLQTDDSKKILNIMIAISLICCCALYSIKYACADTSKIVEGKIVDIFNDEEAGGAYVTIKTKYGAFIIDCKTKSFDAPIAPGDHVKVNVKNVRTMNKKTVGDLVSVLKHIPANK
jgi:hypothetical protein